jgi:uncharacterized protein YbjT (DUF2867 family)
MMSMQSTPDRKMICVFGATGNQGGSVVDACIPGGYDVRCMTRDCKSDDAKCLCKRGCDCCECDMVNDTCETIANKMKGCYACYLMTDYWDKETMGHEEAIGRKLVDAAKMAGIKHLFWSTLPNVEALSGNTHVPHFTDKAKVEEYIRMMMTKSPKPFEYCTFVAPAFYYQNFMNFFPPKKDGDTYIFTIPETNNMIAFDVNQTGPCVVTALNDPKKYNMMRIDFYGDKMTPQQYIDQFAQHTGKKCKLIMAPRDEQMKLASPAPEFAYMFQWFNDYGYYGPNGNPKSGQEATPGGLRTWSQYLKCYNVKCEKC